MNKRISLDDNERGGDARTKNLREAGTHEVAWDLAYRRLSIANVVLAGSVGAGDRGWVLVDTGIIGMTRYIVQAAEERFGLNARPSAIIITHGHFDHTGSLEELAELWETPIYAHPLELQYLNGTASYPPMTASSGDGFLSLLTPLYPRAPVNVSKWLHALPVDGNVPGMPNWQWLHTPGHTSGHISLWRQSDEILIAGDAFITTNQQTAYSALAQEPEMHGPPVCCTQNLPQSHNSVQGLAALEPELVIAGHGPAMRGTAMRTALSRISKFNWAAISR